MTHSEKMMPRKTRFIASALLERDELFLFIKQAKVGGAYPGTLHIPGGGIEQGENPLEAASREILEEVGVMADGLRLVDCVWDTVAYKGEPTVMVFLRFHGTVPAGVEPRASSDAKEIVWLERSKLAQGPHNPATLSLLHVMGLL